MARRTRYAEVRAKLAAGEVREINDLITLNLDIRQFAQDVIERCEGPDLLRAFWRAIESVTVLDPTCGSGAFLFAALNILEPLYEACFDRMEAFVADRERSSGKVEDNPKGFRVVLRKIEAHPNARYFVLKSVILNNLFGVDIMEEAVEICKLRLFLKLAAQVDPDQKHENLGIEPLPDIDFNIRAGNTLVGYATYADVKKAQTNELDLDSSLEAITTSAADLQQTFDAFRKRQMEGDGSDGSVPPEDKLKLRSRLRNMQEFLDVKLADEYGLKRADLVVRKQWSRTHQPFHWFTEFYRIMSDGGFDVIIGNPPYVEFSRSNVQYKVRDLRTLACDNLWTYSLERAVDLLSSTGRISLITPLSLVSTQRFGPAFKLLCSNARHATFLNLAGDAHPSVLFSGVKMSYTIFTLAKRQSELQKTELYISKLYRWLAAERRISSQLLNIAHLYRKVASRSLSSPVRRLAPT